MTVRLGSYHWWLSKEVDLLYFARNWLSSIRLNWKTIAYSWVQNAKSLLQDVLHQFKGVCKEGLGTFTLGKVHLSVRDGVTPVFHRPRPIPFAIRDAIK